MIDCCVKCIVIGCRNGHMVDDSDWLAVIVKEMGGGELQK